MPDPQDPVVPENLGRPEYLAYRVLCAYGERYGGELGRTQYHKLCTIADERLRERGIDVGLPVYWYRHGKTIRESQFDEQIAFQARANNRRGYAYYPADRINESDFVGVDPTVKREIRSVVEATITAHGDESGRELERRQYEQDAPNEFVAAYGALRTQLDERADRPDHQTGLDDWAAGDSRSAIEARLDAMSTSYPRSEYDELYETYLLWDDTFRLLLDQNVSFRRLKEMLAELVEAVSKRYLRFEVNRNVSDETIDEWRAESATTVETFRRRVTERRSEALARRDPSHRLEELSDSYNRTISDELENV